MRFKLRNGFKMPGAKSFLQKWKLKAKRKLKPLTMLPKKAKEFYLDNYDNIEKAVVYGAMAATLAGTIHHEKKRIENRDSYTRVMEETQRILDAPDDPHEMRSLYGDNFFDKDEPWQVMFDANADPGGESD